MYGPLNWSSQYLPYGRERLSAKPQGRAYLLMQFLYIFSRRINGGDDNLFCLSKLGMSVRMGCQVLRVASYWTDFLAQD